MIASAVKDVEVRLKVLGGQWETVGVDRMRGIVPEIDTLVSDEWGSATASFNLHRDPGAAWPDLGAFSDVEIDVGGINRWSGRIAQTPSAEGDDPNVNVQCEGWRAHLDDDCYQRAYVHSNLTDWKDLRSFANEDLGRARAVPVVSVGSGLISFGWPNGSRVDNNDICGVALDLGASGLGAKQIVINWDKTASFSDPNMQMYAFSFPAFPSQTFSLLPTSGFPFTVNASGAGNVNASFATPQRYLALFLYYNPAGGGGVVGQDNIVRLNSIQVFTDTAYTSGGVSILKAPAVINDALNRTTFLLNRDRTGIDPTGSAAADTFAFPELVLDGQQSGRAVIDAANAPYGYRTKIDVAKRMIFEPKPQVAAIEIGNWPGSVFTDSSANSGDDIYNRVIVQGTAADGSPLSVERSSSQQLGVLTDPITSPAADNPSFASATTSWAASSGTSITRDTSVFDTAPASGRWDRGAGVNLIAGDTLTETFTGTFLSGVSYTLSVVLETPVASGDGTPLLLTFGDATNPSTVVHSTTLAGARVTVAVTWVPTVTRIAPATPVKLTLAAMGAAAGIGAARWWVDSLVLATATPTVVDKRGFRRTHILPIRNSLTVALAQKVGDSWLGEHLTTPLKGTVVVTGDGGVRDILTGRPVPPEELLTRTGEMLRLSHRVDPDTGGWGRDGRIAQVSYSPSADEATVALDATRTNVDALLSRLAVVVGSS